MLCRADAATPPAAPVSSDVPIFCIQLPLFSKDSPLLSMQMYPVTLSVFSFFRMRSKTRERPFGFRPIALAFHACYLCCACCLMCRMAIFKPMKITRSLLFVNQDQRDLTASPSA